MVRTTQTLDDAEPGFGVGFELAELVRIDHIFDVAGNQNGAPVTGQYGYSWTAFSTLLDADQIR